VVDPFDAFVQIAQGRVVGLDMLFLLGLMDRKIKKPRLRGVGTSGAVVAK